jgi:DNA-binding IscR family transcriptional regulator
VHDDILAFVPHGIERAAGIRVVAEMAGLPARRTRDMLRDLERAGLVIDTKGAVVGGMRLYHYWYRPG